MEHHQELGRARTDAVDLTEDSPAIAAGEDGASQHDPWHAVFEVRLRQRDTPKAPSTGDDAPSTGGDWEMLSPAKGPSACDSSTHSVGDHEELVQHEEVEGQEIGNEEVVYDDPLFACKDTVDNQTVYVVKEKHITEDDDNVHASEKPLVAVDSLVGLTTWLASYLCPHTMSGINDYVQQAMGQMRTFVCREWATVGLGAGVVVLGTMLCSSYVQNRRMTAMLRSKDREVAKLVMKILSLQDTLQGRRLPIVRHTAWASFPSEIM